MRVRMKYGLVSITVGFLIAALGIVLIAKNYIDAVYAEAGWHPTSSLLIAPVIALLLVSAGTAAIVSGKRRHGAASSEG